MNHNEEELQKELKELKLSNSLDRQKKKSMRSAIKKHAQKKRKRKKWKKAAIWTSTAAALFLASIFVFQLIYNNPSVLPADDHNESYEEYTGDKEPSGHPDEEDTNTTDSSDFSLIEEEKEAKIIMIEGMEEEVTVTNYTIEPYGIHYQMEDFLGNYDVEDGAVRHYSDADNTWITLDVAEDAAIDDVISDIQSQYSGDFNFAEEPAETSQAENAYEGISQHFSDPPQGYYAYQIGENVLIIQYEYVIEASDGMGPRLQALRESIE